MKVEVEITEDQIREMIERKVRILVADHTNRWDADAYIKDTVEEKWSESVSQLISEALSNADALRKDAARYRWLRERDIDAIDSGGVFAGRTPENVVLNGVDLDEAIDSAMTPNVSVERRAAVRASGSN